MDRLILVFYVGCKDIPITDISEYIERVKDSVTRDATSEDMIQYFIPIQNESDCKIECLNPKFVTDAEMVEKFNRDLKRVNRNCEEIINHFPYTYKRRLLIEKI